MSNPDTEKKSLSQPPKLLEIFGAFFKLGLTAFGGPAMVAHIGDLVVDAIVTDRAQDQDQQEDTECGEQDRF